MPDSKKSFIRQLLEKEVPGVRRAKEYVDERLTRRVVEPLARKGYEDLGAAIATVPSAALDFIAPDNVGEAALMAIPAAGKATGKVAKAARAAAEARREKELVTASDDVIRSMERAVKEFEDVDDYAKYIQRRHNAEFPKDKMDFATARDLAKEEMKIPYSFQEKGRIPSSVKPFKK